MVDGYLWREDSIVGREGLSENKKKELELNIAYTLGSNFIALYLLSWAGPTLEASSSRAVHIISV